MSIGSVTRVVVCAINDHFELMKYMIKKLNVDLYVNDEYILYTMLDLKISQIGYKYSKTTKKIIDYLTALKNFDVDSCLKDIGTLLKSIKENNVEMIKQLIENPKCLKYIKFYKDLIIKAIIMNDLKFGEIFKREE